MSKLLHALLIGAAALLLAPSIAAAENPAASGRDGRQVFTTGFGSSKSATAEKSDKSTKKAERKAEKKKVERQAAKKAKAEEQPKPEHVELRSDTQEREPKKYGQYKDGMPGGPDNPLGARAMYLYQGKRDTHIRVHGTNQPWTIGTDSSNGCFRMINEHVMDLYTRVRVGADMVVL